MHPMILGLFETPAAAASAARALHQHGIARDQISVVSRNHDEEGALAAQMDATPGADVEDSRPAARLGELSAQVLAAIAVVLPGVGPIVAAGPLAAGLGEAAGHVAGGVASVLGAAGVDEDVADELQREVEGGAVLLAVHLPAGGAGEQVTEAFRDAGARNIQTVNWPE
jgi:hypothetical protein